MTSLAYSANGRHLCAGLESGAIQVFNLSSKAQQFALETQTVNHFINIFNTSSFLLFINTYSLQFLVWNSHQTVASLLLGPQTEVLNFGKVSVFQQITAYNCLFFYSKFLKT